MSTRRWMAVAFVVVAFAACGGGDGDDDATPVITDPVETTESTTSSTTSTPETTVDPDAAVEAEVEAAYLAYLDAYFTIFAQPNPTNTLIDRHTTGPLREKTLDAISADVLEGRSVRRPADSADFVPTVLDVAVDGQTATLEACVIDGSVVIDNATGEILNDAVATLRIRAELVVEDGVWKVAESNTLERKEGRTTCDA